MKKVLISLALAAFALALVPTLALAAVNVKQAADGTYYNAQTGQKTDASGNALIGDFSRDRDKILSGLTPIISASLAVGAADSLQVPIDVHDYANLSLILERTGAGDARVAIQVRYHIGGFTDTTSTAPWMPVTTGGLVAWGDSATTMMAVGSATTAAGDEGLFRMTRSAALVPAVAGRRVIPLAGPYGPQWFDYITVRIRILGAGGTCTYRVSLVGTAVR